MKWFLIPAALLSGALLATPASAVEETGCKRPELTAPEQVWSRHLQGSHSGFGPLYRALDSRCRMHDFLVRLMGRIASVEAVTADDIVDAAALAPRTEELAHLVEGTKRAAPAAGAGGASTEVPLLAEMRDGIYLAGAFKRDGVVDGHGIMVDRDGAVRRGDFREGRLHGIGYEIDADGSSRAGDFVMGQLSESGVHQAWDEDGSTTEAGTQETGSREAPRRLRPAALSRDDDRGVTLLEAHIRKVEASEAGPPAPAQSDVAGQAGGERPVASVLEAYRNTNGRCSMPATAVGQNMSQLNAWYGKCVDGWRDGHGIVMRHFASSFNIGESTTYLLSTDTTEGNYAKGFPRGLWCTIESRGGTQDKPKLNETRGNCQIAHDGFSSLGELVLRKSQDGNWQLATYPTRLLDVYIPTADIESVHSAHLKAAPGGVPDVPPVRVTSPALAGLMADDSLYFVSKPLSATDFGRKRIAIILSTRTTQALSRWRVARDAFVKENGYGAFSDPGSFGPTLEEVMTQSDPTRMLGGWLQGLGVIADRLVPAKDLTVLASGEADVALVLDWTYEGGMMKPADYQKIPACDTSTDCHNILDQRMVGLLVDRELYLRGIARGSSISGNSYGNYRSSIGYAMTSLSPEGGSALIGSVVSEVANKLPGSQLLEIARKYESGNGVKADKSRAMTYYLYASAKGNGYARYKTGMAYRTGNGLPKDVAQGTRLVHEASDLGDGDASTELTILYSSENSGVTKDLRTAARYARTAYRQKSDPYTRYNMGIVTSNGWDEPADPVKATKYFTEAQQLGHAKAAERIAELAPKVAALQAAAATSQPADPSFIDSLKDVPNAGALFALGDEADEKGLKANARAAFRALVSRFPDSPLATKAADRLVPR